MREECVKHYTDLVAFLQIMLSEKDINPMRPWDMELPKFINDPRYRGVKTLRERRDLFDDHCKHLVRERRAKKAAGGQTKADVSTFCIAIHPLSILTVEHFCRTACHRVSSIVGVGSEINADSLGRLPPKVQERLSFPRIWKRRSRARKGI